MQAPNESKTASAKKGSHRMEIDPMSIAWKATMLPLRQPCLKRSNPEQQHFGEEPNKRMQAFADRSMQTPTKVKSVPVSKRIASHGNRTHVNSLEDYYATTTPTMLEDVKSRTATFY